MSAPEHCVNWNRVAVNWLKRRFPHKSTTRERFMLAGMCVLLLGSLALSAWNPLASIAAILAVLGLFFAFNRMQKRRILGEPGQ